MHGPPAQVRGAVRELLGEMVRAEGLGQHLGEREDARGGVQQEVRAASHWWTYRSTKARRELGWRARPHEETLEATVAWHLEREHDRITRTRRSQQLQYRAAGAAIGAAEGAASLLRRAIRTRPWLLSAR